MLFDSKFLKQLEGLELLIRKTQTTTPSGERVSKRKGGGLEFKDYRQYQLGDDYRYIDWNLLSRLGQVFLKQFVEERDAIVYFLIDKSSSMVFGNPTKLELSLKMAAALGYISLAGMDRVGAASFSSTLERELAPVKGKVQVRKLFYFLQGIEGAAEGGKTSLFKPLNDFSHKFTKPGLAVVITDLFTQDDYRQALLALRKRGWEVLLIQTLAGEEIDPEFSGNVYLKDKETGEERNVNINRQTLQAYRERLSSFTEQVEQFSKNYNIRFHQISNEKSLLQIIYQILQQEEVSS